MSDEDRPRRWDLDRYKTGGGETAPPEDPFAGPKSYGEEEDALVEAIYDAKQMRARYRDDGSLLWVALKTAVLSVLTLGIYRFWMVARLRRYFAGAVRVDGDPVEYTGTGLEKLLGFLLALIVLAVYLGLVNLALTFIGLSYFEGEPLALQASVLALVPFYFWAGYRARRYLVSRLRWRGIRLGVEPGAWGYTLRSILLAILTVATAGLAYPYMHFKQQQFMTDRSWFGDMRFRQGGSWIGLLSIWIWIYIAAGVCALLGWGIIVEGELAEQGTEVTISVMSTIWVLIAIVIFFAYQVGAFRYLWDNRSLGEVTLSNDISIVAVFMIYIGGYILVSLCTGLAIAIVGAIVVGAWALLGGSTLEALQAKLESANQNGADATSMMNAMELAPFALSLVLAYLLVFAVSFAFTQAFITQPILRRKVEAMTLTNPGALREAAQRKHDEATEAGGFADALGVDVGAGF